MSIVSKLQCITRLHTTCLSEAFEIRQYRHIKHNLQPACTVSHSVYVETVVGLLSQYFLVVFMNIGSAWTSYALVVLIFILFTFHCFWSCPVGYPSSAFYYWSYHIS